MTCPHCNRVAPDDARFCPYCAGALLPADQKTCPDCGEPVGPRDRLCTFCGARLRTDEPPPPQGSSRSWLAALVFGGMVALVLAAIVAAVLFLVSGRPVPSGVSPEAKPVRVPAGSTVQKRLQRGMVWDYIVLNVVPGTTVTCSTNGPSVDMCVVPIGTWKSARTREQQDSIINEALRSGEGMTGAAFSLRLGSDHSMVVVVIRYSGTAAAAEAVVTLSVERP